MCIIYIVYIYYVYTACVNAAGGILRAGLIIHTYLSLCVCVCVCLCVCVCVRALVF